MKNFIYLIKIVRKFMKTPKSVNSLECVATCVGITLREFDEFMSGTTKADGYQILRLIKKHLPDLYDSLNGDLYNPYIDQCRKKKGLLVYVHSAIEYFLQYD